MNVYFCILKNWSTLIECFVMMNIYLKNKKDMINLNYIIQYCFLIYLFHYMTLYLSIYLFIFLKCLLFFLYHIQKKTTNNMTCKMQNYNHSFYYNLCTCHNIINIIYFLIIYNRDLFIFFYFKANSCCVDLLD
jgi:hypothetical protein